MNSRNNTSGTVLMHGEILATGFAGAYNQQSINQFILKRQAMVANFNATKVLGQIAIDENNKPFQCAGNLFAFDNLLSYELLEDGSSIQKGGLGRAVAGGLLFGRVGAIVGGVAGKKKSKSICNSMQLRVSFKNAHTDM